ncbi:shieldin complex subunit 1 [Spea bombifrons]|uniref:shieldin complex subunit 1 n=1 Tax=Spea bombifrons TaxID=233779 RepID=UPI00234A7A8A|nr:shieldin complex subunit 1 [Spea bombifrons]
MEQKGATPSQASESSNVLDISWTYDISHSAQQREPPDGIRGDDFNMPSTPASSGPLADDADSQVSVCEDEKSHHQALRSASHPTATSMLEDKAAITDNQIKNNLESFYELNCQKQCNQEDNAILDQLSEKISDLRTKNQMYALRSFQMARIILNRDGSNVLRNHSTDSVFSSAKPSDSTTNTEPIPGISEDAICFIRNKNKS